jgi:nucleoside-diphosphate-sugar epimerase
LKHLCPLRPEGLAMGILHVSRGSALNDPRPAILVTGISGNLGRRLLPLLSDCRVVGVDISPVPGRPDIVVHPLNIGHESSCVQLVRLLRETGAEAVVHLAFVIDPLLTGVSDRNRMWQINVAGTARVMEAIAEVNRHGGNVRKFIYPSSVSVYGPETPPLVDEDAPLRAHTLTYAVQKAEADGVVRFRAISMGNCSTYLLRPHIFAGSSVENYLVNAIRGRAYGNGKLAARLKQKKQRLPLLLPYGESYPKKLLQFVHVDDVARLIAWLLQKPAPEEADVLVLNVAGSGMPISISQCAEIAQARIVKLPTRWLCAKVMALGWSWGVSSVPSDVFPYMCGSYTINTKRLRDLLGSDYNNVIRYSTEAALRDSFAEIEEHAATQPAN